MTGFGKGSYKLASDYLRGITFAFGQNLHSHKLNDKKSIVQIFKTVVQSLHS